jgi:hypothetical protein
LKFEIKSAELALFHLGIGMLLLEVVPVGRSGEAKAANASVADWLDMLHFFRLADHKDVWIACRERTWTGTSDPKWQAFWPKPSEGLEKHPDGTGKCIEIINALLQTAGMEPSRGGFFGLARPRQVPPWWHGEHDRLIPFAILFAQGDKGDKRALLYRARNFLRSDATIFATRDRSGSLKYANGHWFFCSQDGGGFLGWNSPDRDFWLTTLPSHLRGIYRFLFQFVLYQRLLLLSLSETVARDWLDVRERYASFEEIRRDFLSFTARGEFGQLTRLEHYNRFYKLYQETVQVQMLYEEVKNEVYDMQGWLVENRTRRIEHLVASLGIILGGTSAFAGLATLLGLGRQIQSVPLTAGAALVLGLVLVLGLLVILINRI